MKAVLISNADHNIDTIASAQLDPFFLNRRQLKEDFDLIFEHRQAISIQDIIKAGSIVAADTEVLFIRPDWREHAEDVVEAFKIIRAAHPSHKIICIDPWDQVSSRFFGVLPYVNKLLKYQRFKDVQKYRQNWIGGTAITDYLVNSQGYDIGDWHVGSDVPPGYENRIATGWNVVTAKRFQQTLFPSFIKKLENRQFGKLHKSIDIFCHLSYNTPDNGRDDWYTRYRKTVVESLQKIGAAYNYQLAVSGEYPDHRTISSRQYFKDIRRSRIVVAPFGWGETTWRDYEAICYECLLIKPDMSHVDTSPNIYYPNETYVPVKWDFSDLEEKCAYYLANSTEQDRIIANAQRLLKDYFLQKKFSKMIGTLLAELGSMSPLR